MSRPENEDQKDRIEKTARELRKHRPRPSEALVSRIERLTERGSARRSRPAQIGRRKLVLALAAALSIAVAGAIVRGELQSSKPVASSNLKFAETHVPATTTNIEKGRYLGIPNSTDPSGAGSTKAKVPARSSLDNSATSTTSTLQLHGVDMIPPSKQGTAQITTGNRLAELRAVLTLKVANSDELSRQTAAAMKIARRLSGYVVTAKVDAPSRGIASSYLVLKVPAARSQDALIAISALGKILSQQISLDDVKATVSAEGKSIQALKREIASLEQTLSQQTLTPQARSQLQIELARDRAQLSSLRTQRTKDILRGRLATITLTLTTGDLPKLPASPSRIHKAVDKAWNGLSSEISWAATGIIIASPFLLLAAALALALRSRRRREERRLLEK